MLPHGTYRNPPHGASYMSHLSLHRIKSISLDAPARIECTRSFYRHVTIIDDKGNEFQLSLFAENKDALDVISKL